MKPIFHDYKEAYEDTFGAERSCRLEPTEKQKAYIINMWDEVYHPRGDYHVCGFPFQKTGQETLSMHPTDKVHVHHIIPKGYAFFVLGWDSERINSPDNLIPICEYHHITNKYNREVSIDPEEFTEVIHPDMAYAFRNYNGTNDSFNYVFQQRDILLMKGLPYHNTWYDRALYEKAVATYDKYLQMQMEQYGKYVDTFPYLKRETKYK